MQSMNLLCFSFAKQIVSAGVACISSRLTMIWELHQLTHICDIIERLKCLLFLITCVSNCDVITQPLLTVSALTADSAELNVIMRVGGLVCKLQGGNLMFSAHVQLRWSQSLRSRRSRSATTSHTQPTSSPLHSRHFEQTPVRLLFIFATMTAHYVYYMFSCIY